MSLKPELIIQKIHMSRMRTTFSYFCSGGILHESYAISEGVELFLVQSVVSTFSLIMLQIMSNVEHGDERDDWWHNSKPG
jgi:hypothetical protein